MSFICENNKNLKLKKDADDRPFFSKTVNVLAYGSFTLGAFDA